MKPHILVVFLAFLLFGCTQPSNRPANDTTEGIVTAPEVPVYEPQNTSQTKNQSTDTEPVQNETANSSAEEPTDHIASSEIIDGDGVDELCNNTCISISQLNSDAEGNDCDNLNGEYVVITNSCSRPCNLTGWTVKDASSRNSYVFPSFVLQNTSSASLYTGCGADTATQLYWCSSGYACNAIWNNDGDTLYMIDSQGSPVLSYSYS
ncbi:MAG: lamin tail domain-containing protein [Candidatus ainarchaeum sp.]|nr:lamin tail domain-containing protein [Candidatus ainarchaeum sp.]